MCVVTEVGNTFAGSVEMFETNPVSCMIHEGPLKAGDGTVVLVLVSLLVMHCLV